MIEHFRINHRLRWAFMVCQRLGIDDPVHWMNTISPSVLDQWIAYELLERDEKQPKAQSSTPEEALSHIQSLGIM